MSSSILNTTKKLLGIPQDYTIYDEDIIVYINSALMTLNQNGIGPSSGFRVIDSYETWTDLVGEREDQSAVQLFVYATVRLAFDPPSTSYGLDSFRKIAEEALWRLNVQSETEGTSK